MKTNKTSVPTLSLTPGRRLMLAVCVTVLFYVVTGLALQLMRGAFGADNIRMLRIAAVMQDMLLFVLPAVIVAVLLTRLPARFLAVDSRPRWRAVCLAALTMIVSIPAMNWVIEANASLPLPEGIAASLRQLEETAARTTEAMLGGTDIGSLVMNLLIIAVLAGFSEELFFRGMVQRLFVGCRWNAGVAIWVAAALFSAMHMQVFGFVPRLLLGAFFGYLLLWSGSLWLPIAMHVLNNTIYIISRHCTGAADINVLGTGDTALSYILVGASVALTAIGLVLTRRAAKTAAVVARRKGGA